MPVDYSKYPKNWKTEIRPAILKRADYKCEWCGVPDHAVGYRDADGRWNPLCGNLPCDAAGIGQVSRSGERLSYAEAREFADAVNDHWTGNKATDSQGNQYVVIVLTIAHINDPDPMNCDPSNLAALCQRCHNRHDGEMRRSNAKATRAERIGQASLLEAG